MQILIVIIFMFFSFGWSQFPRMLKICLQSGDNG